MIKNKLLTIFVLLLFSFSVKAQDTLNVMHYNLLNYGNITSYCTSSNNDIQDKDPWLKIITDSIKPDIFTVNELGADVSNANNIVANVLNTGNVTSYQRAALSNPVNSPIVNMLFYNSEKLGLYAQEAVAQNLQGDDLTRVIDIYKLYYKNNSSDTVFLTVVTAHLKAGSSSSDSLERVKETEALMNYLIQEKIKGNIIFTGDFNFKGSDEGGYLNIINEPDPEIRFYDPVDQPGDWNNNMSFADYHTQSTHLTTSCPVGGGLDDRFDLIMANSDVMNDSAGVQYIPGSYAALGQDGAHFNQEVNDSTNNAVSATMADALYNMSDHLPVVLALRVTTGSTSSRFTDANNTFLAEVQNPFSNHINLQVSGNKLHSFPLTLELYSVDGRKILTKAIYAPGKSTISTINLENGIYFLRISSVKYNIKIKKLVKINPVNEG